MIISCTPDEDWTIWVVSLLSATNNFSVQSANLSVPSSKPRALQVFLYSSIFSNLTSSFSFWGSVYGNDVAADDKLLKLNGLVLISE